MRTHTTVLLLSISLMGSMDAIAATPVQSFQEMAIAAGTGSTPAPDSKLAIALRDEGCVVLNSFILGPGIMSVGGKVDARHAIGSTGSAEKTLTVDSMGQKAYATCAGHNVVLGQHVRVTAPEGGTVSSEARLQMLAEEDGFQWGTTRSPRGTEAPYLVAWRDERGIQHSITYVGQVDGPAARAYLMPMAKRISQQLR